MIKVNRSFATLPSSSTVYFQYSICRFHKAYVNQNHNIKLKLCDYHFRGLVLSRGVPIIGIAYISAGNMLIFTTSVIGTDTKEADTSADIALAKFKAC